MHCPIITMVMACTFQMLDFVGNIELIFSRQPATLHSKAMQGQEY